MKSAYNRIVTLRGPLASLLLALLSIVSVPALAKAGEFPEDFKSLYVFGDSLNDPGNASAITTGTFPPPSFYPVARFSNGPVAAEYLAGLMEVPSSAFYANPQGTNFAVGGATTGSLNYNFAIKSPSYLYLFPKLGASGIKEQIQDALASGSFNPEKTLFLVSGGANDIFLSLAQNPTGLGSALAEALQNQIANISLLASRGARYFVVPNIPNIGATPEFSAYPPLAGLLAAVISGYNSALLSAMAQLETQLGKHVQIKVFDSYSLLNAVIQAPANFGFENVTTSCLSDSVTQPSIWPACTGYAFYDGVHPTTAAHGLFAEKIFEMLDD